MVTYWLNTVWLMSSPDLNPLGYGSQGIIQVKVIATAHPAGYSLEANCSIRMEYLPCVEAELGEGHRC
jgi:hypothetical protein